jgi:hypothetical protein
VDCAQSPAHSANANPASVTALEPFKFALMTLPPARSQASGGCAASLHYLDANIRQFGNNEEEYFPWWPNPFHILKNTCNPLHSQTDAVLLELASV